MNHPLQIQPPRNQRGAMLLVVLAVGTVLLLLATTTLLSARNSVRISGIQRLDFQDLHAADAGIVRTRQRLNALPTMCNGYFSAQDDSLVRANLIDTTYLLPSPYGSTRAVHVRTFVVDSNARPMRVRFSATGGRANSDGSFNDAEASHTLNTSLRMQTMADYALFVETGTIPIGAGSFWKGRVHGNSVTVTGNPVSFLKEVTYVGSLSLPSPSTGVSFHAGHRQISGNPLTLERIFVDDNNGETCGGSPAHTYRELALGDVSGEKEGLAYTVTGSSVFIPLDSIQVVTSGGNHYVRWQVFTANTSLTPPKGTFLMRDSVSTDDFNGIVYVQPSLYLAGNLRDVSLTLVSGDDIFIADDVLRHGSESRNPNVRVTLGLIAKSDVRVWEKSPTWLTVQGATVAVTGKRSADGDNSTHSGRDSLGNSCSSIASNHTCWRLTWSDGGANYSSGNSGIWTEHNVSGSPGHQSRVFGFSQDNFYSPPPKFPMLWGQNGALPVWEAVEWGENEAI